jgi:hypothetical protein
LLDQSARKTTLAVIDKDTKAVLQKISDNDPIVKASVKEIMNLPELTEEQIKRQIAKRDKYLEEH